jgi:transcription elongation factor Elf1
MEYYFEEPTIKRVKVEISPCPCCGSERLKFAKYDTGNGCDRFSGRAFIKCSNCKHIIEKESNNIGYGDTLDGLFDLVLAEWNGQSEHYGKRGQQKDKKILAWIDSMRDFDLTFIFQEALDRLEAIVKGE